MEAQARSGRFNPSASSEEEINIYLKVIKTLALNVKKSETIKNLKAMLREKEGIAENLQELFFLGDQLKDGRTLVDHGIEKNSTLHLVLQNPIGIKIFIKIPSYQRTIMVEAKTYDTIWNIKAMIQAKEGIQSDQHTLIYGGKQLEDNMTLASLNIQCNSTLHLVFNPIDVLSICVKTPTGKVMQLEVKVLYTVCDVKAIVGSMTGIPASDQRVIFAGKELDDCRTLAYYDIKEASVLEILLSVFQIFVKTWSGKTIILDVHYLDTVRDIKDKIFQKVQVPVDLQSIIFAGKRLEESRDLASYNIQEHSTLHMGYSALHMNLSPQKFVQMQLSELRVSALNTTTIHDLKAMIQQKMSNPVTEVYFHGKALQDKFSLAECRIGKNAKVVVCLATKKAYVDS
ncbi:hypothetical protein L1049_016451 [Liquidambar formosana]|uniref:Ubiquitin-like domain-containing protein n=1 Tax=Liquidambar formosana TaxID=63359 RepID=A0AAP0RZA1_LIQFO